LPASAHPRQPPSKLSCVHQSPRPSSLPPGVEAAERTRKGYTPSRATTSATGRSGTTQIGSKRAFPIKLKNGLTSTRVQTDLRRQRSIRLHAQCNPIFMSMGGQKAHGNSKPPLATARGVFGVIADSAGLRRVFARKSPPNAPPFLFLARTTGERICSAQPWERCCKAENHFAHARPSAPRPASISFTV